MGGGVVIVWEKKIKRRKLDVLMVSASSASRTAPS
jgi:hypothetical protein